MIERELGGNWKDFIEVMLRK
ncbi:protein YpfM [Escherichia coli]|nr:protein YpfM [Escherichia coli]